MASLVSLASLGSIHTPRRLAHDMTPRLSISCLPGDSHLSRFFLGCPLRWRDHNIPTSPGTTLRGIGRLGSGVLASHRPRVPSSRRSWRLRHPMGGPHVLANMPTCPVGPLPWTTYYVGRLGLGVKTTLQSLSYTLPSTVTPSSDSVLGLHVWTSPNAGPPEPTTVTVLFPDVPIYLFCQVRYVALLSASLRVKFDPNLALLGPLNLYLFLSLDRSNQ